MSINDTHQDGATRPFVLVKDMNATEILRQHDSEVRSMKAQSKSMKEIAAYFGISNPESVRTYCSRNKIRLEGGRGDINRNDEEKAAERIREESDGLLEYVSGYMTKDSQINVRCNICGGTFSRSFHHLTTHKPVCCPICTVRERERVRAERETEAALKRAERKAQRARKAEEAEARKAEREHKCPVCGTLTLRPKYCSEECARRAANKVKDQRRRIKIAAAMVDKDITVEGLFKRDKGVCYLCGCKCDYEDFTVVNGNVIAGDWYPSIDHIVPLSKGGAHSWKNVKLAHRRCNYLKSDK